MRTDSRQRSDPSTFLSAVRAPLALPALLALLATACARTPSSEAVPAAAEKDCDLLCETVALGTVSETWASASFLARNGSSVPIRYLGFGERGPLYECEVLEGAQWKRFPLAWCGTGAREHELAPGGTLALDFEFPRDGRSYRFRFGEPAIETPAVALAR
jgi:hypothetical protein